MIREIMEVPFPLAASSRLMSFFTFQISMFFSASFAWASLISAVDGAVSTRVLERFFVDRNLTLQYTVSRSFQCCAGVTWDCGCRARRYLGSFKGFEARALARRSLTSAVRL